MQLSGISPDADPLAGSLTLIKLIIIIIETVYVLISIPRDVSPDCMKNKAYKNVPRGDKEEFVHFFVSAFHSLSLLSPDEIVTRVSRPFKVPPKPSQTLPNMNSVFTLTHVVISFRNSQWPSEPISRTPTRSASLPSLPTNTVLLALVPMRISTGIS